MKRTTNKQQSSAARAKTNPFRLRNSEDALREVESKIHVFGDNIICDTESRGYATPGNRSVTDIVLDASEGFIPLWAKDMTLRWRFQERSMSIVEDPEAAKTAIKELLGEAILAWDNSAPIKFTHQDDVWDFEIVVRESDRCNSRGGCVLASAFFPDAGRHELVIYPKMFTQSRKEQVDTLIHEIGHIFGLRHFFANISETDFPSEIFGTHKRFTIMNYGGDSELTDDDRADLKRLYQMVWNGELTQINGTRIQLVEPFHTIGGRRSTLAAINRLQSL